MRLYSSFSSLSMTANRMAASKVPRNEHRNNVNSQIIFNSAAMRAFASRVIPVPGMGDSISEGVVEEFVKGPGEFVEADEIVARIETDKVTVDITSPEAGVIKGYLAAEGDTIEVGADFFELDTDATGGSAPATPAAPKAAAPEAPKAAPVATPAAPAAPPRAAPTGPPKPAPAAPKTPSTTAKKAPTEINGTRTETRVPMNRMRIRIADRLKDA